MLNWLYRELNAIGSIVGLSSISPRKPSQPAKVPSEAIEDDDGLDRMWLAAALSGAPAVRRVPAVVPAADDDGLDRMWLAAAVAQTEVSGVSRSKAPEVVTRSAVPVLNASEGRSAHSYVRSAHFERSAEGHLSPINQPKAVFSCTVQELRCLTKALTLKAEGANKQEAIERAFSCTKGGGAVWRRASALFDEARTEG